MTTATPKGEFRFSCGIGPNRVKIIVVMSGSWKQHQSTVTYGTFRDVQMWEPTNMNTPEAVAKGALKIACADQTVKNACVGSPLRPDKRAATKAPVTRVEGGGTARKGDHKKIHSLSNVIPCQVCKPKKCKLAPKFSNNPGSTVR